jgi:hypothetical protein
MFSLPYLICFVLHALIPEVGKVNLKNNGDEAFNPE